MTATASGSVSLLAHHQEPVARHLANRVRDLPTQFDAVPHRSALGVDVDVIDGARA